MSAPEDLSQMNSNLEKAGEAISSGCGWAAATAFIPLPILDLTALAAVQANMINEIAKAYGQTFTKEAVRGIVSVLLGTLIPGTLTSGLKFSPGVGTMLGAITHGAFSSASTYAVGKVLVRHFENGGTSCNFDAQSVTDELKKEFSIAQNKPKTV